MIILRDYQTDIINKTRNAFRSSNRVLVHSECGSGKTAMFAVMASNHLSLHPNGYVWFLVHRKELITQTINTFTNNNISLDNVLIGMVQTITRHIDKYKKPTLIIIDECHHSTSKTYTNIIDTYKDVPLVGLTATPARLDGKPLGNIYDTMIHGPNAEWLIEHNYLAPYKYYAPHLNIANDFKRKGSDYDMSDVVNNMEQNKIYGNVLEYIDPNKQGILYAPSIELSKKFATLINEKFGNIAIHFDGDTPKKERDQIVSDYKCGKIKILCNVDLIGEGFDVPDCEVCYLLRPTLSPTLYIQQSIRCMRPKPNKLAYVYDFVGNVYKHGMPSDTREWSLERKIKVRNTTNDKELLVRQCKSCFRVYKGVGSICPYCGYDNHKTKTQLKIEEKAKLEEVKKVHKQEQSHAWTYEALRELGLKRGYRNPSYWAKMVMRNRRNKI